MKTNVNSVVGGITSLTSQQIVGKARDKQFIAITTMNGIMYVAKPEKKPFDKFT